MLAAQYDRLPVEQWLASLGATLSEDACGPQAAFGGNTPGAGAGAARICPLPDLGVIQVSGPDARSFLHGQLSNDLEKLDESHWRRFAYCNAKGRMQLSALGFVQGEQVFLVCTRSLAPALAKRLSMFVLRAKAKVSDVSARFEIYGLLGQAGALFAKGGAMGALPAPGARLRGRLMAASPSGAEQAATPGSDHDPAQPVDALVLPDAAQAWPGTSAGGARSLWLAPAGSGFWSQALALGLQPADSGVWRQAEIAQGEARIVPATHECFVPQMLNFESIGGVDFKKGCYPGQEVVARSQYLGKLKRRMFVGWLPGVPEGLTAEPAQDVWPDPAQPEAGSEPAGQVVMAAAVNGLGWALLFESQTAAATGGRIGLKDAAGLWHAIEVRALPYPLLEI